MITSNIKYNSAESFIPRGMLTEKDNLNNIYTPGIYTYSTNHIPQNCPFQNGGIIEVVYVKDTSERIIQRVTRYGKAGQSAERVLYGSEWLAWTTRCAPVNLAKTVDYTPSAANTYYRVTTVSIPAKSFYSVTANPYYSNACPRGVRICSVNDVKNTVAWQEQSDDGAYSVSATTTGYTENALTLHIFAKWSAANQNALGISGFYTPA